MSDGMAERMKAAWTAVRKWAYKWVGGLVMEEKKDGELSVSLGRVSFVAVLGYMVSIWERFKTVKLDPVVILDQLKGAEALTQETVAQAVVDAIQGAPALATMPPGVMEVFYVLAGYILGGKAMGALKEKWKA